jgi:D-arginine utilization repressor
MRRKAKSMSRSKAEGVSHARDGGGARSLSLDPFRHLFGVGEAVATLLHPYAEVVIHDLRTGRIVRIWNSFSDRQAGDLSNLKEAEAAFPHDQRVLGPYDKALNSEGRTKSITAAMRDENEELFGFMCINLDVSLLDRAAAVLSMFASSEMKRPEPIYRNDMKQHINYLVRDYSIKVNRPIDNLTKEQRIELVSMVDRDGLFQARNSVKLVATAMKISRASVYNLLAETSKQPHAKARSPVKKGKLNGHPAGAAPGLAPELNGAATPIPARRGRAGSAISRRGSPGAKQATNLG